MHKGAASPFHGDLSPILLIGLLSDKPWGLSRAKLEALGSTLWNLRFLFPGSAPVHNPPELAAPRWGGRNEQNTHGREVASCYTSLQVLCFSQ